MYTSLVSKLSRLCVIASFLILPINMAFADIQRSMDEFLSAQGSLTRQFLYNGIAIKYHPSIAWLDPASKRAYVADYAGTYYRSVKEFYPNVTLPPAPSLDGTVTEKPLADGSSEITVLLHSKNVIGFAFDISQLGTSTCSRVAVCPALLSSNYYEAINGGSLAVGDSYLKVTFTIPQTGGPLPDLVTLPASQFKSVLITSSIYGPLRAGELDGIAAGTPGRASTVQVGLVTNPGLLGVDPNDAYPVEHIDLQSVGALQ